MDHEMSMRTQAAERYLLGELPPAERDAFEQHYFDCQECAESVRLGFQFSENARSVFREEARRTNRQEPSKAAGWFAWLRPGFLVPATACLLAVAAYQNALQIPALRARITGLEKPLVLSAVVLTPSSRSAIPAVTLASSAPFLQLTLAVGAVRPAERYEWRLRSESGKIISALPMAKLDPGSNITVLFPARSLSAGAYDAVLAGITGENVSELEHYRFAVRRE